MSRYEPYFKSVSKLGEVPWEKSSRKKLKTFKRKKWGFILENFKRKVWKKIRKTRKLERKKKVKLWRKKKGFRGLRSHLNAVKGRKVRVVKHILKKVYLVKRVMKKNVMKKHL